MEKVKIKTSEEHLFGKSTLMKEGTISFDKEGIAEIDYDVACKIIEKDKSFTQHSGTKIIPIKEEIIEQTKSSIPIKEKLQQLEITPDQVIAEKLKETPAKSEEDLKKEQEERTKIIKKQTYSQTLAKDTYDNLRNLAKDTGLPKGEWDKLKKLELVKYLVDKNFEIT